MISGTINSELEALVRLWIRGPEREVEAEVIVDTGFNGTLILSPNLITELGLRPTGRGQGVLADGSVISFPLYEALIFWNDRLLDVNIGVADTRPFIGMSLLRGSELAMQVIEGGAVSIHEMLQS